MADERSVKQFALALYAREGVSDACLHLQGRHDVDVNLVLFAAFVGAERRQTLTAANLDAARRRVDAWHREVVRPLRTVRKRLKTGPAPAPNDSTTDLRSRIQHAEIEAELIELDELGGTIPGWESVTASGSAVQSAAAAIEAVILSTNPTPIDEQDRQAIEMIARAASAEISRPTTKEGDAIR